MNVRANPNDFGAQVGQAVEGAGKEGFDLAMQKQGFINETNMNNAEVGFIKDSGDLKAKYSQYEGLQAEAARPQYEAELEKLHNQYRQGLPPIVQRAFDATTLHQMAYQTNEYSSYAAGQVKQANIKSQDAVADTAIAGAGNLGAVLDDSRFGAMAGTIKHTGNALADIHGDSILATGQDDGQGNYSYPDTPEGQAAQARHLEYTNTKLSQLYLTGAKTVADNQGAVAAGDWAQKHWDMMPDKAKVEMNQFLAPKMKNEVISGNITAQNNQLDIDFNNQFTKNVPTSPTEQPQQSPLDVIRKNEGVGYSKDNKGEVVNGINSLAFPKEFAEAKQILDTQGQPAATKYADAFYQKNIIDKYDIKSLPANTQAIVADAIVNQSAFGISLLDDAKNGATPQQLIEKRRAEYKRLADSDIGKPADQQNGYATSLDGWNKRLDNFQVQQNGQSAYPNKKDFLESQKENYVNGVVDGVNKQYGDYYLNQIAEKRAAAEINRKISIEDGKLKSDRDTIINAIGGSQTKGQPIATYEELRALPGMLPLLDKVHSEQGAFAGTIDTMITKASHGNISANSPNAYDAIQGVLNPPPNTTRQGNIEYLSKGLGSDNPGFSISQKDFNDAKPAVDLETGKDTLSTTMKQIAQANGNLDGKGQDRAVAWYNQVMAANKQNESLGDKKDKQFFDTVAQKYPPPMPSRMEQISNHVQAQAKQQPIPVITTKEQRDALPSGSVYTRDGQQYTKQ